MPEVQAEIRTGEASREPETRAEAVCRRSRRQELVTRFNGFSAIAAVSIKPDPTALPGSSAAQKLLDGATYYVILACVAGGLFGLAQWALGSRTSNYSQADSGKSKFIAAVLAAFLTGALAAIINFFVDAGSSVK